jgi:hypothetical protein
VKHGKSINSASFKLLSTKHAMNIASYRAPSTRTEEELEEEESPASTDTQPPKKTRSKKTKTKKKSSATVDKENMKNLNKRTAEVV